MWFRILPKCVGNNIEYTENSQQVVQKVYRSITDIADLATQIATASNQQNMVAQEINQNIVNISDASQHNLQQTELVESEAQAINKHAKSLAELGLTF